MAPLCCRHQASRLTVGHRGPHNVVNELFSNVLSKTLFTAIRTVAFGTVETFKFDEMITDKILKYTLVIITHW